ncbi:hypothetical protein DLJ47_18190 [Micromonospora sp. S4605]|uniref:hypothetical protein n=1 Tax=Micromonospora sp. S4605 TaxID=1420897 RepID=UPI000D7026B0|nr:hypothetical protein [Micromonospora sp. S4605]PWU52767.1 hypothetical protein DLJ47_18190 [Micromonospora sp. S4605]
MTTLLTIPSHYTQVDDGPFKLTWECACGDTGVTDDTTSAGDGAFAHQREEARKILIDLNGEQFAALLRAGAANDWRETAAVELLVRHETWLYDETLRMDYLDAKWTANGDMVTRVNWWAVGETAGSTGRAPLDGSESEMTILRVAASIGGDMPLRLHLDTTSLDTTNRGLVLTAIGHLLSHGGGVQFASATAWTQLPQRRRHDYC